MSGRGRQARTNVLASNGDRQAKNRGSLITSTRSSSGSPSQRTRSLTPKVQETGVGGGVKPKKRVSNSSVTQSNPASSLSNRRNSTERRKIRRPKFQDNPPGNVQTINENKNSGCHGLWRVLRFQLRVFFEAEYLLKSN